MQEAEYAEPVLDRDDNGIRIFFDEICPLLTRFNRPASGKSSAVNPYHDRLIFFAVIRFPYVKIKAVFTPDVNGSNLRIVIQLAGSFPVIVRLVNSVIRNNINRSFPAEFPDRLPAHERNALVGDYAVMLFADKCTVDALDRQRLVINSVSDSFVLAVLRFKFSFNFVQCFFCRAC